MSKELLDLIKTNLQQEEGKEIKEDELTNYDEWIEAQASKLIINNLRSIEKREDKIAYLNKITNNAFQIENKRIKVNDFNLEDSLFNELIVDNFYNENLWDKIESEFLTCNKAVVVSPFIGLKPGVIGNILRKNKFLKEIKIITTTYSRFEPNINLERLELIKALDEERIDIKIEYVKEDSTRLHSKIYYFERENNMSSIYIGSSNFSKTGLENGNEVLFKISEFTNALQFEKVKKYFTLLEDNENMYDINHEIIKGKLKMTLLSMKLRENEERKVIINYNENSEPEDKTDRAYTSVNRRFEDSNDEFKLYTYQKQALEKLNEGYSSGKTKQLVAMATGTGKTVIASGYVTELENRYERKPKILFIAHIKEILDQAQQKLLKHTSYTQQDVAQFYDGYIEKDLDDKLFFIATNKTFLNRAELFENHKFDLIIIDEVHHLDENNKTYSSIYEFAKTNTKELLGLTATPFRGNGDSIEHNFDWCAFRLPLFDAVERKFLAPFNYYLSYSAEEVKFNIDKEQDKLVEYLNDSHRVQILRDIITDKVETGLNRVSCLIFCSRIDNAKYIKDVLVDWGYKAKTLSSRNDEDMTRDEIIQSFRDGEINYLCVVDIFNEGIDIPEINNIIFLRPTSSKLKFIQQLGRGLRLFEDKKLNVFDIVHNINIQYNKQYNPFNYLSELATFSGNGIEVIENPKILDQFLPEDCQLFISEKDSIEISNMLKEIERNSNNDESDFEIKYGDNYDFESYCKFIKFKYDGSPTKFYESNKMHLFFVNKLQNENVEEHMIRRFNKALKLISIINIREVIEKFVSIIESKHECDNKIVNALFLRSFYHHSGSQYQLKFNSFKECWEKIFESQNDKYFVELKFLCQYMLKYSECLLENKINNTYESFGLIRLTSELAPSLIDYDNINKIGGRTDGKGVIPLYESNCIFTISKDKRGYIKEKSDSSYFWVTPSSWATVDEHKTMMNFEDVSFKKYVFQCLNDDDTVILLGDWNKFESRDEAMSDDGKKVFTYNIKLNKY
jgi:superfamily II DNA or RNA helicase/HKD family nuclease